MNANLVTTEKLTSSYCVVRRTLMNWTEREFNPFPKPILGSRGSQYRWLLSAVRKWEESEFGEAITEGDFYHER